MPNFESIKYETINDRIALITLNRPDKLNSLTEKLLNELQTAFTQCQQDNNIKGLIITGEGKAFCAGADVRRLADLDPESGLQFAKEGQDIFRQLETLGKPSLAAVNGYAFGGGCELSMAATIRMASVKARFGQPEVKLGIIPGYGGTQRLVRLVGKGRALDLCLSGRFIKADEALSWGLVTAVHKPEELLQQATDYMEGVLQMGPIALDHVMQVIDKGFDMPLDEAFHLEAEHFAMTCATQDKQEGVQAFLEKRDPEFQGE